jgi:hypothetical protein
MAKVFKRKEALDTITESLAWIRASCELRGLLGFFDNHIVSNYFFCRVLNTLHNLDLKEMDLIQSNYPAIDLGDTTNKTSFQVTSDESKPKIQYTLDKFMEKKLNKQYDHLTVLIIGKRQQTYKRLKVPKGLSFDKKKNIIDLKGLMSEIRKAKTPVLERLATVFHEEIGEAKKHAAPLIGVGITRADSLDPGEKPTFTVAPAEAEPTKSLLDEYKTKKKLVHVRPDELRRVFELVGRAGREGVTAAAYNGELDQHLREYQEWLDVKALVDRIDSLTVDLGIWASNKSEVAATDMEATLTFPDACAVVLDPQSGQAKRPQLPLAPTPPKKPSKDLFDFLGTGSPVTPRVSVQLPDLSAFAQALDRGSKRKPYTLKYQIANLRPGESVRLGQLAVVLHPAAVAPVNVKYRIVGTNMPKPSDGFIRVDVARPPSS